MHQNAFGGHAPPGPARGAYSAPPDPVTESRGEGRGVGDGKGREREGEGKREG